MPTSSAGAPTSRPAGTFAVVQMNLCNSGLAPWCYSFGRAVDEAVAKIRRYRPDLVTLQEVCRGDLYAGDGLGRLPRAMADRPQGKPVSVAFTPVFNRDTDDWFRCAGGDLFGVAVIHHGDGGELRSGWYASQDSTEEVRVWACSTVIDRGLTACTTHLSTDPGVAARQCRELMSVLRSSWVLPQVVVAGDLNLVSEPAGPYSIRDCAPADYDRRSDDAVQQILFTRTIEGVRDTSEDMRWTDHPLLYALFRL